ncbi:hypothetical protein H0H92_004459 [Tricholoma furcatifolium]|nr:hypothetical protein H0H92_004459 [Tricholoma furcatifolium]
MLISWPLLVYILVLINMYRCSFCTRTFSESRALSVHQSKCPKRGKVRLAPVVKPAAESVSSSSKSSSHKKKHVLSIDDTPQFISDELLPVSLPDDREQLSPDESGPYKPLFTKPLIDYLPSEPSGLRRSSRPYKPTEKLLAAQQPIIRPSKRRRMTEKAVDDLPLAHLKPDIFETDPDAMGLFRRYNVLPSTDPDEKLTIHHVADAPSFIKLQDGVDRSPLSVFGPHVAGNKTTGPSSFFAPFLNATVFRLMNWFYQSTTKTLADLDDLVHDVILHPDFATRDLEGFSASRESKRLEEHTVTPSHSTSTKNSLPELPYSTSDNWKTTIVDVPLPLVRTRHRNEQAAPTLSVPVIHRDLLEVIESLLKDYSFNKYHLRGFKQFWRPSPDKPKQRVYSEVYNTDIFLDMEERLPIIDGCNLEKVVLPLLIYSDSTHLANFGTASLWPIYIWTGSLSKYTRIKPTSFSAHHLAYLPSLFNQAAPASSLKHMKRELVQAIWEMLLSNKKFREAYEKGIVVCCGDGTWRRFFIRFFAYLADYVERIIIACMKQNGHQFCATCTVTSNQAQLLGTKRHDIVYASRRRMDSVIEQQRVEKARVKIFKHGYVADGKPIDNILKNSKTPIRNAFSRLLLPNGENFYNLFVVDVLHEIELGVIKHTFTHLIRMLYTLGAGSVAQLDRK